MPWQCPRCAARLSADFLEGTVSCPWCGSVVYSVEGEGIPHKIVSSCRTEDEIRHAALDCFRRRGRSCAPGTIRIVYVPYYVFESDGSRGEWTGLAAVGLPSAELLTIPIFGTDTRWFDATALPGGTHLMEASRSLASLAGDRRALEMRHVPIAHVTYEDEGRTGSLWIDADRGRVLAGGPPPVAARRADKRLGRVLWCAAGAAGFCGLVLPPPLSLLAAAGAVIAVAYALGPKRPRAARVSS